MNFIVHFSHWVRPRGLQKSWYWKIQPESNLFCKGGDRKYSGLFSLSNAAISVAENTHEHSSFAKISWHKFSLLGKIHVAKSKSFNRWSHWYFAFCLSTWKYVPFFFFFNSNLEIFSKLKIEGELNEVEICNCSKIWQL